MKTIGEYERDRERYRKEVRKTGIACPKCGVEMLFRFRNLLLQTYPPRKAIECPACNFTTTISV